MSNTQGLDSLAAAASLDVADNNKNSSSANWKYPPPGSQPQQPAIGTSIQNHLDPAASLQAQHMHQAQALQLQQVQLSVGYACPVGCTTTASGPYSSTSAAAATAASRHSADPTRTTGTESVAESAAAATTSGRQY